MSNNQLRFSGLEELKRALRDLPAELTADAGEIITSTANVAAREIVDKYPTRTGNLKDGVKVTKFEKGRFSAGAIVKSSAKHAFIFENGTQARHTDLGANRGSMPAGHVFIPVMIRRRREMYEKLKALLTSNGLIVSGEA